MQIFNQFSFLIFVIPAVIFGVALLLRDRRTPTRLAVAALLVVLVGVSYAWLRPGAGSGDAEQVQVLLLEPVVDRPVFLEIYSNYCVGCLRSEPIVDQLEEEWGDRVEVVRLNIHEGNARSLAYRLDFRYTPTFILFSPEGDEVWRHVGVIDADAARAAVDRRVVALGDPGA